MRILVVFVFLTNCLFAQKIDTIPGFDHKIAGEEIVYFSPYQRFAKSALLTRCNNNGAISWSAKKYDGKAKTVCYELLIGHSTGTSSGERKFLISLNGKELLPWTTFPKMSEPFTQIVRQENAKAEFNFIEFDANRDAFGKLYITVPSKMVKEKAEFSIEGVNQDSRDWLMVFQFQNTFNVQAEATQLITKKENKRQLNAYVLQPFSAPTKINVSSAIFDTSVTLPHGYHKLNLPVYAVDFTGTDTVSFEIEGSKNRITIPVTFVPATHRNFHIIHHSHNDIGYSHLQTEVAQIQTQNIRSAMQWIKHAKAGQRPIWHIESLWAVENFLNEASEAETNEFVHYVKAGNLVLSANYANILTGLSRTEELDWMLEYAKQLEQRFGFTIKNAMITDIPGITSQGLDAYVRNNIPYLSLGPNYVEAFPDHGDRVGGVIQEQGDRVFNWKPTLSGKNQVKVWTAGKGYSFFHNIADNKMQEAWEQRLSDYSIELDKKNYWYDMVQLRYTKKSDNGPVDTNLCNFIDSWNATYSSPTLVLSSLDELFVAFEQKYGDSSMFMMGEIAPYWEDGAYSTAAEEIQNRTLSAKTSALERKAKALGVYANYQNEFYQLHRAILLFHEHTWGAWCSVSDPEAFFTTEQWRIKQSFVDSAQVIYNRIASKVGLPDISTVRKGSTAIIDFQVDPLYGGISTLKLETETLNIPANYGLFEGVYQLGTNPMETQRMTALQVIEKSNTATEKVVEVSGIIGSITSATITYRLDKKSQQLQVHYRLDKVAETRKESFHVALTPTQEPFTFVYGSDQYRKTVEDQLNGSNREFVCTEDYVEVQSNYRFSFYTPQVNLIETNGMIDETLTNGVKTWKKAAQTPNDLFLYVFNNYWHTNYKASQEGRIEFDVVLVID